MKTDINTFIYYIWKYACILKNWKLKINFNPITRCYQKARRQSKNR